MKRIVIATLALGTIVLSSCNKEELTETSENEQVEAAPYTSKASGGRVFSMGKIDPDTGWMSYEANCDNPGSGCTAPVVVNGIIDILDDIIDAVGVGNAQQVVSLFTQHESTLDGYLENSYVDGVISGNLTLETHGSLTSNDITYFVYLNNANVHGASQLVVQ